MDTYNRLPVSFERGQGSWVWDIQGRPYLDALSGIAVCGLGHAHPAVASAVCEQARTLVHTSNLYGVPAQEALGERLCKLAEMDRAFFCNSGAEANEAAIKLARLHGHRQGIPEPVILVMEGAFHGRTLATLSATANPGAQTGFGPLVPGFVRVPYDDVDAVAAAASEHPGIVAVLVEPIQGEGGIRVPSSGYLSALRAVCDRHGWLLMLDEVQTGVGRTGRWFAHQHETVCPDVVTLAKGLANGVPIGACLARGAAASTLTPGSHGSTFGGNPLACAAASAVLETIAGDGLLERANHMGRQMIQGLRGALGDIPAVREIRGQGLMIGVELDRPCADLIGQCLDRGVLVNVTAERVVRLLPPLVVSEAEAERIVASVSEAIRTFLG